MARISLSLGIATVAAATGLFLFVVPASPILVGLYGGLMGLGGVLVGVGLSDGDPDATADATG